MTTTRMRSGPRTFGATRSNMVWTLAILVVAVMAFLGGVVATTAPLLVMVPVLVAALILCLVNGTFRLAAVILGALIVFQSSSQVSATKLVYAAFLACVVGVSVVEVSRRRGGVRAEIPRVVMGGLFLALALIVTLPVALARGTSSSVWVRDYVTYGLVAIGPLLGYAAVRHAGARRVRGLTVVCALVSAVGFAVDWLNRRGISSLSVERFALGSGALVALGFALLIALAVMGRRTVAAVAGAAFMGVSQFVTGTRSSLVFLAAPLTIVVVRRWRFGDWRALRVMAAVVALAVVAIPLSARYVSNDNAYLEQRLSLGIQVLTGSLTDDLSYQQRTWAYDQARSSISAYPVLGTGLGYEYPGFGTKPTSITLDTPLITVAKLGLVGTTALVVYLIALIGWLWRRARRDPVLEFTIAGFVAVMIASIPLGSPVEDKGFGLALMLLTALVMAPHDDERVDAVDHGDAVGHIDEDVTDPSDVRIP